MKILKASWLISCDSKVGIIKNAALVYNDKIIDVGDADFILNKYPNCEIKDLGENSVLMPGLINSHIHLEFSANTTSLSYGNFMSWLNSVIVNRETLIEKANSEFISKKLDMMLKTGTTTIGAISSYSYDLDACAKSAMNTVFFAEAIGSKMDMVDTLFSDFKARLSEIKSHASGNFFPGVAIHSPYSVHPFLVREALNLARADNLAVSTHFMESPEEKLWLNKDEGGFLEFSKNFLQQEKAVTKPLEFLNNFKNIKKLSFTHCVEANEEELLLIKELGGVINHCITSNRLLNNTKLDISALKTAYSIGTDGLSSNNSLSMFDELRNVLMMHENKEINAFAAALLVSATKHGSDALGLNKGILAKNFDADIISLLLPDSVEDEKSLCTHVILHTKRVKNVIIGGLNV